MSVKGTSLRFETAFLYYDNLVNSFAKHSILCIHISIQDCSFMLDWFTPQAFQVLSEYLQLLDGFSELLVIQEMSRGVEVRISFLVA